MFRGSRGIVLVLGWLILAASPLANHPNDPEKGNVSADASQSSIEIGRAQQRIAKRADPSEHQKPCADSKDDTKSDLCAQWYSARAAGETAKWSFWSIVVSGVGTLGLLVTIIFNYLAWEQARESREDTNRAIREARRSNLISIISEKRARRASIEAARVTLDALEVSTRLAFAGERANELAQLARRPWMGISDLLFGPEPTSGNIVMQIKWINSGGIPALVSVNSLMLALPGEPSKFTLDNSPSPVVQFEPDHPQTLILPGGHINSHSLSAFDQSTFEQVQKGEWTAWLRCEARYTNIETGTGHHTQAAYRFNPAAGIFISESKYNNVT